MDLSNKFNTLPKVSIGLPIYNGSDTIRKRLENIFSQTLTDFELLISDNGSTDSSVIICNEFSKKDKRIRFFQHTKNKGWVWNYIFVLEQASCDYFVWTTDDDMWNSEFLEKNVNILDSHKNIVGSIGKMERVGVNLYKQDTRDSVGKKIYKKIRRKFRPFGPKSLIDSHEEKLRVCFKNSSYQNFFSVFRTDKLRKSIIYDSIPAWDAAMALNILKFGDIHVIDELLIHFNPGGLSSKSIIEHFLDHELHFKELFFPHIGFGIWCTKQYGIKFFMQNFDQLIWLFFVDIVTILTDPVRFLYKKYHKIRN